MAVNTELLNWENWKFRKDSFYSEQTSNPLVGFGGQTVYQQVMEQNNQTSSTSMTADGQVNICNDECLTIVGGVKKEGGNCLNIMGKNGDVTITAENNGAIKIKGPSIIIDADTDLILKSKQSVWIKGSQSIFFDTPNLATNACVGNLAPRDVTVGGLVCRGTKIGGNVISDAFTGGALENLQDQAKNASSKLKDLAQNIDTESLTAQATELGGQLQNQLSSIDTSGLSNALKNFGGFT